MFFLTRQVEERIKDVEALCVSTLNEFVGVHLSDIRSEKSIHRKIIIQLSAVRQVFTVKSAITSMAYMVYAAASIGWTATEFLTYVYIFCNNFSDLMTFYQAPSADQNPCVGAKGAD